MKKYFYYVVQYRTNIHYEIAYSLSGVCRSSSKGLFPLIQVLNDSIAQLNSKYADKLDVVLDVDSVQVINVVEISKDDFFMVSYDEIHGKDSEK